MTTNRTTPINLSDLINLGHRIQAESLDASLLPDFEDTLRIFCEENDCERPAKEDRRTLFSGWKAEFKQARKPAPINWDRYRTRIQKTADRCALAEMAEIGKLMNDVERAFQIRCRLIERQARNEHLASQVPTPVIPVNDVGTKSEGEDMFGVIDRLDRRIFGIVRKFHLNPQDEEDVFQEVKLALIEKAIAEPTFTAQEDAYILQFAKWSAAHLIEKDVTYVKYVSEDEVSTDECGDEISFMDFVPDGKVNPENWAMWMEMIEATFSLSPKFQQVLAMLFVGYKQSEVADEFHVSKAAVTQWMKAIQTELEGIITTGDMLPIQMNYGKTGSSFVDDTCWQTYVSTDEPHYNDGFTNRAEQMESEWIANNLKKGIVIIR